MNADYVQDLLLEVRGLKMWFPIRRGVLQRRVGDVRAVDGLDFDIYRGETLGSYPLVFNTILSFDSLNAGRTLDKQ